MNKNHLPIYGVGPLYVCIITALTAVGMWLAFMGRIPGTAVWLKLPGIVLGVAFIAAGVYLWYRAAIQENIDDSILKNQLRTNGVYAWVRNPIYSGITIALTGCLLFAHNLWLLVLPFVFWAFMTVLLRLTEEKWLTRRYGALYTAYCRKVNRCIPWPPGK